MRDHKLLYGTYLRTGILASLVTMITLFLLVPYRGPVPYDLKREVVTMIEEITYTIERFEEPPRLERPRVAVEAENEIAENVVETIGATDFREEIIRTTPTGPEIEIVPYYKVEVKPQPIVQTRPRYPPLARKAGIEGTTVVKALIDVDGSVMDVQVLKSSGNQMLDEAALAAARQWRFSPAKQRDKHVRVHVSIPVNFRLVDAGQR